LLQQAKTALFEGPLDEESMKKVVDAGLHGGDDCLLRELDEGTRERISSALKPSGAGKKVLMALQLIPYQPDTMEAMIKGMKPWMAFFAVYTTFVRQRGWKFSVDLEAYTLAREMGKNIVALETIEEQIEVLDGLPLAQIIDFLKRVDHWSTYMAYFLKWYLDGDLEKMGWNPYGFPTRNPSVIDRRDKIMYRRMLPYLEQGDVAVFVGSPHVVGISRMLKSDGCEFMPASGSI